MTAVADAPPPRTSSAPPVAALDAAAGVLAGFGVLGVVDALAIAVAVPLPAAGLSLRLSHQVFDLAETLAVGAVAALCVGAFLRVARPRWARYAAGFAAASVVVYVVVGGYLALQAAHALDGRLVGLILANDYLLLGSVFVAGPTLAWVATGRPRWRFVPTLLGVALMVGDQVPLRDDYVGIHGLAAAGAALIAGPPLAAPLLGFVRRLLRTTPGRGVLGVACAFVVAGLVPPPNATRQQLFRQPSALASWTLAATVWPMPSLHAPVVVPPSPWIDDRSHAPPRPPTSPPLLPHDAVVVLLTIDALRAEAVMDPAHDAILPTFKALKRDGVVFTRAETPGAQTPTSLATMFTSRYYSELRWADYGAGADRYPYPAEDPAPRFPELLSAHGVRTAQDCAFVFLVNAFGVARGFREERSFGHSRAAAAARYLVGPMLESLGRTHDEPAFYYAHFGEPHAPYLRGKAGAPAHERYLASVVEADAQVGRVLRLLEARFGASWVLIVSADHGEAFGEHEMHEHSKSLYEELLHVPLIVRSPLLEAHEVDARVGLVDLGPTILDLFGVETPATFDGESLVPLLEGKRAVLTRPLFAEGRLARSYTGDDGLKVIEDPRKKVVEVYDLATDPGETRNLFDVDPGRADRGLAFLRAYFAAHVPRGYEPPYKP